MESNFNMDNVNEIDMECKYCDDDDFGSEIIDFKSQRNTDFEDESEERPLVTKTGIMLDFRDDDETPLRTISADFNPQTNSIETHKNFSTQNNFEEGNYNEIDMECKYGEDDDMEIAPRFLEDDDEVKEFVDEEFIDERKKKSTTTQGAVEANYLDKLAKQHAATNKKGAYNTHFHFAGDPQKEIDMFNHDMKPVGPIPGTGASANITGVASAAAATGAASAGGAAGGDGGGCCESLEQGEFTDLQDIFDIAGFDVERKGNTFIAHDICSPDAEAIKANSMKDLLTKLQPYIDDCYIVPLQIMTNQKFSKPSEWVKWYSKENKQRFPKCKNDIESCAILSKYLGD